MNTIALYRTGAAWFAQFAGPAAQDLIYIMGSDTLPTGFTGEAEASKVQSFIAGNWPQFEVRVA